MMQMTMSTLVETVTSLLQKHRLKLATAESCTGGGLAYRLTSRSGSSNWFERGFVTYSLAAKVEQLGIQPNTLAQFGAVSKETALAMAEGALSHSRADMSIAITGIAGPDDGSTGQPIGTVWIAWASHQTILPLHAKVYAFQGTRHHIRQQAIVQSLQELRPWLQKI